MRLKNKLALITGAASGIGAAGAVLFAREGATVALVDRDEAALAVVAKQIRDEGGRCETIQADLADQQTARLTVSQGASLLDGLDIVWCNAGIAGPVEVEKLAQSDYDLTVAINQTAVIVMSSEAIPFLRERGGGSIIITSSQSGLVGGVSSPVYSATKSGVIGWTRSLALRAIRDGIRVNAICPGPCATPLMTRAMQEGTGGFSAEEYSRQMTVGIPIGRLADPIEIAYPALWLASEEASFITGIAMPVDGGYTCR